MNLGEAKPRKVLRLLDEKTTLTDLKRASEQIS